MTRHILTAALAFALAACSQASSPNTSTMPDPATSEPRSGEVRAAADDRSAAIRPADGSRPVLVGQEKNKRYYGVSGAFQIHGVAFPEELAGYARSNIVDYGSRAGGYSVGYNLGEASYMTVYVYGQAGDLAREMESVKAAIGATYPDATLIMEGPMNLEMKDGDTVLGTLAIQYARASFTQDGEPYMSDSLVLAVGERYLKLRITSKGSDPTDAMPPIPAILAGLGLLE